MSMISDNPVFDFPAEQCQFTGDGRSPHRCASLGAERMLSTSQIRGRAVLCELHAERFRQCGFSVRDVESQPTSPELAEILAVEAPFAFTRV